MFRCVADIQTADMLNLPVPEAKFETVLVEPSELQKAMVQDLSERAAAVQRREVRPEVDNMREQHVTATKHEENVTKAVTA